MSISQDLFSRASQVIPGGVNSPVRAFKGVGGEPIFFKSALGAHMTSTDNKKYIDYIGSWGPMLFGHNHPEIVASVLAQLEQVMSLGAPCELEVRMAEKIVDMVPSIEKVRMLNSGTEATMTAVRLARGYTGKTKILKFEGCYHGHVDSLLVKAGSGALTLGTPSSPGIPADLAQHTLTAGFNQLDEVELIFQQYADDIACIIVEPIAGNMNMIKPTAKFIQGLSNLCKKYGSLLIFDEVMTGFRVAQGGAQSLYQITPDLTTLGKVIGAGMPVGALGGRSDIMDALAPVGPVYQAGTLSGNPLAMAAGLQALTLIEKQPDLYQTLEKKCAVLCQGITEAAKMRQIPMISTYAGGMFGLFFTDQDKVETFQDVSHCNIQLFNQFFHEMLNQGVYLAPSAYEAGFVSAAHDDSLIHQTIEAAKSAFQKIKT